MARAATSCAACGHAVPVDARFCPACGVRLGSAAREERKAVSVVFADLVGYTARAEQLDPEETRALLAGYWEGVRRELERFGGTVEKYIGDAVVGLFGAPLAHEDDAERAVRAAVAICGQSRSGHMPPLRVAVATGTALVRLDAAVERGEAMVVGDVVNTASRLQTGAATCAVLVDEATYRATRHAVRYRSAAAVPAKGKREPVRAWEAVAVETLPGERPRHETVFVGRLAELALLRAMLERVRRERAVQLVTLVGVPGIGKSRLLEEFAREGAASPDPPDWWQGRSLPYGDGVTFWAFAEIVKTQAGILETDASDQARTKVAALVGALLPAEERPWVERHAWRLAGVSAPGELPGAARLETFAAWRRLVEAAAERRLLVLVLEDVQWADDALLDFVEHLVEWAGPVPLLVVCSARPELLERRPAWGGGLANALTLSVPPLSDEETAGLFAGALGRDPDAEMLARAGGNPLYAEQLARMLLESGLTAAEPPVPDSVQGIVAARLDGLPPAQKAVLQDAAVAGKAFRTETLAAVRGSGDGLAEALHALERGDLVRRSSTLPSAEYSFCHRLVCEVAYEQLSRAARGEKHLRLARWLDAHARPDDAAELLAHHYLRAREYASAAGLDRGELDELARTAVTRAAGRALGLNAFTAARRLYESALDLWPEGEPGRGGVMLRHALALWTAEGTGEELAGEARAALREAGDVEGAAEAEALLAEMAWFRADRAGSWEALDRAVALVHDRGTSPAKARVLSRLARSRMVAGDASGAVAAGRQALALAEELGLVELQAEALNSIGSARARAGDEGGLADVERAALLAPSSRAAVLAYNNLSAHLLERGDRAGATACRDRARAVAERLGDRLHLAWLDAEAIGKAFDDGAWDEVLGRADAFLAAARRPRYLDASVRLARASVLLARDEADEALREVEQAEQAARAAGDPQALAPGLGGCALIQLEAGRPERAAALAEEVVAVCRRAGELPPLCSFDLAVVLDALGRADELEAVLALGPAENPWIAGARALATGDPVRAAGEYERAGSRWAAALMRLRAAEAGLPGAEPACELALTTFRSLGARRYLARAEAARAALTASATSRGRTTRRSPSPPERRPPSRSPRARS